MSLSVCEVSTYNARRSRGNDGLMRVVFRLALVALLLQNRGRAQAALAIAVYVVQPEIAWPLR